MRALRFRPLPILLLLMQVAAAHADDVASVSLSDEVPGISGVTYLDLVRQVVPDIAAKGNSYEGRELVPIRHIDGDDTQDTPPLTVEVAGAQALPIQSDGNDRLLLMIDLGQAEDSIQSFTVLALYGMVGIPSLLDVVDVGYDRLTSFREPATLALGEGRYAVVTASEHFNAGQDYVTSALILLRNDRLELIDTVFTFSDAGACFVRGQVPAFRPGDRGGRAYSDIEATVTETTTRTDTDCSDDTPTAGSRSIAVTYRWDEASSRFVASSDALERLAAENEERF